MKAYEKILILRGQMLAICKIWNLVSVKLRDFELNLYFPVKGFYGKKKKDFNHVKRVISWVQNF